MTPSASGKQERLSSYKRNNSLRQQKAGKIVLVQEERLPPPAESRKDCPRTRGMTPSASGKQERLSSYERNDSLRQQKVGKIVLVRDKCLHSANQSYPRASNKIHPQLPKTFQQRSNPNPNYPKPLPKNKSKISHTFPKPLT